MPIIVFCARGRGYKVTQKQLDRFKALEEIAEKAPTDFYRGELAAEMGDLIAAIKLKPAIEIAYLVTGDFA